MLLHQLIDVYTGLFTRICNYLVVLVTFSFFLFLATSRGLSWFPDSVCAHVKISYCIFWVLDHNTGYTAVWRPRIDRCPQVAVSHSRTHNSELLSCRDDLYRWPAEKRPGGQPDRHSREFNPCPAITPATLIFWTRELKSHPKSRTTGCTATVCVDGDVTL